MENYTFTRANPSVSLYTHNANQFTTPSTPQTQPTTPTPPSLILLLPWMGATKRQTESYIRGHITLFAPSTPDFLVISSGISDFVSLSPAKVAVQSLKPAIEVLKKYKPEDILVHIFSNGGVRVFANLARAYRAHLSKNSVKNEGGREEEGDQTGGENPLFTRLAIDSAPGRLTFAETMRAVSSSLPRGQPLVKWPAYTILAVILALYLGVNKIMGWRDPLAVAADALNDPEIVGKSGRRCYFYSKRDDVVRVEIVEGHVAEARTAGVGRVDVEVFEDSAHVRHVVADGERYWGSVARL
ncbi:hypothetical protein BJY04DRAFT_230914 [Aspergillus karnatakaensis]|uniref:uncharacterized protein n=1 Tax=Aspergillus karnatakaensis TaxID=1810916 RepID=UPI003CCD4B2B